MPLVSFKALFIFFILGFVGYALIFPVSATSVIKSVEFYCNDRRADEIPINVLCEARTVIYSDRQEKTSVEVMLDTKNWPDQVLGKKDVVLIPGENRVNVTFMVKGDITIPRPDPNLLPPVLANNRGVYVRTGSSPSLAIQERFDKGLEVKLLAYTMYAAMKINGVQVYYGGYPDVKPGDQVECWVKLYRDGSPAVNEPVYWDFVIDNYEDYDDKVIYTNSLGDSVANTTAPNWAVYSMCGGQGLYYTASADNGNVYKEFTATYTCDIEATITITSVTGYAIALLGIGTGLIYGIVRWAS
ncbi:hypothetical protein DRP07_00265 [Archaeoglobales archaeon]|nr:MAG: hypothetical protein DRP07_00265 [Archaeoglobales archaeon]